MVARTQPARRFDQPPSCLIDASIYIFQYYFSLPDHWSSDEGWPTAAVYGYATFLLRLIDSERPRTIAACFDESLGTCFRNDIYSNYKMSRALPDEALAFQLDACREITELLGIASFSCNTYEADDYLGSLTKRLRRSRNPIAILSRDKDLGQLIRRDQDFLWDYAKNERYYPDDIQQKFGVTPQQLADYLALVGDNIDDIPGVPGLGPQTARALLNHFPTIDKLFQKIDQLHTLPVRGAAGLKEKLLKHREQIDMSRQLTRIVDDVPLEVTSADLRWRPAEVDMLATSDFCQRMGFSRLAKRIENVIGQS